jgi:hypothetical protein
MNYLNRLPSDEQKKIAAWTACRTYGDLPPQDWRIDDFGNPIYRADYGKQTQYGWEIDHRLPSALGGSDGLHNLRALHYSTNRSLGAHTGNALKSYGLFGGGPRNGLLG